MSGDLVIFVGVVALVVVVGIALGILASPRLTGLVERLGRDDDEERDGRYDGRDGRREGSDRSTRVR